MLSYPMNNTSEHIDETIQMSQTDKSERQK